MGSVFFVRKEYTTVCFTETDLYLHLDSLQDEGKNTEIKNEEQKKRRRNSNKLISDVMTTLWLRKKEEAENTYK